MKQTNYKKSINSLKGLFLTGLILLSSSLFGQVYDAEFRPLNFGTSPLLVSGSTVNSANAQILYRGVININGQDIDCRITNSNGTTTGTTGGFDGVSNSFTSSNSNDQTQVRNMLSLEVASNSTPFKNFNFEFGIATMNGSTLQSFQKVTLDNIYLNIYDIDRDHSGAGSIRGEVKVTNTSFSTIEYSSQNFDSSSSSTMYSFTSGNSSNNSTSTYSAIVANTSRIRLVLVSVSDFNLQLGTNNTSSSSYNALFYLGFSQGPTFGGTIVSNSTLSINLDLNGSTNGISNTATYNTTNSTSNFTVANTSNLSILNATSASRLTNITVKFNTSDIKGGSNELLRIGSTEIPLNADLSSTTLTLNSVSYDYEATTTNSVRTISFSRISGTNNFTQAQGEALLDALQYVNKSTTGNIGTRIFSINATLDLTTDITSPTAFFTVNIPTALPVNIISFTGKATANGNQLNWTVAQEENFSHYEVLSSINGSTYNKVGEVYPENKSMDMKNYAFTDLSATADLVFYKLNLINEDGSSDFSNIVAINRNSVAPVITNVYPNPATTSLLISLEGVDTEVSTITIQDLSGKIVYTTETSDVSTLLNINELNKGLYLIKVSNSNGIVSVSRFAKN